MRWTDFFNHLEHDFALDCHADRGMVAPHTSDDSHLLDVCARAKASGGEVTVGVVTGDVLHVFPRAVATQWFSGLVGGERGSGVVIPLAAVEWVEGRPTGSHQTPKPVLSATLADVLADIAKRSAPVTIQSRQSDFVGRVVSVGDDYVDVAGAHSTPPRPTRRFLMASIVAIFQGGAHWG